MKRAGLVVLLALVACAERPPVPVVEAPTPQAYTCEQSQQAGREYDALPPTAQLRIYLNDYYLLRRQLRRILGLPEPSPCSPTSQQPPSRSS